MSFYKEKICARREFRMLNNILHSIIRTRVARMGTSHATTLFTEVYSYNLYYERLSI